MNLFRRHRPKALSAFLRYSDLFQAEMRGLPIPVDAADAERNIRRLGATFRAEVRAGRVMMGQHPFRGRQGREHTTNLRVPA